MSSPRVPSHHAGGRIAATTMASGAPPATSTSTMSINASQAAAAAANQKPKTQINFGLPGFHIECSFPGCSAKLDGTRDVFCSIHMQSLSKASKPLTGQGFAPSPSVSTTNGTVPIAATVVVARPHPSSQPQPSPTPAPGISSPSPQRQLPTLNPRKMLPENGKSRPIFLKRKSAANPSRIITQQPTPKHSTPPLIGESAAATALPTTTTTTADPPIAPPSAAHSLPISPSPSQSCEPVKKRPKFSESLGNSSESRLNEQTTHRTSTPAEAANRPITQGPPKKDHTPLKTSEKNTFAPSRISRAQPIRKMALPATVNFINKPKQSSAGPSPEMSSSSSFYGSSDSRQKTDHSPKFNQSFNGTPSVGPSLGYTNADPRSADKAFMNGFHFEPANSDFFKTVKSNQFYGKQASDNGQPQANGQSASGQSGTSGMFQADNRQQSNSLSQQTNSLFQANMQQQPHGKGLANGLLRKAKSNPTQVQAQQAAVNQPPHPPAKSQPPTAAFDSDVDMVDTEDSDIDTKRNGNRISSTKSRLTPLITITKLHIPSRPSGGILPADPSPKPPVVPVELSDFDALIYSQEGASAPPPGFLFPKRKPPVKAKPQPQPQEDAMELDGIDEDTPLPPPKPKKDEPLYANIDPRVHWPKNHSEEWYARKQAEIAARGKRKDNYGKAAQRMKEQNIDRPDISPEEFENSLEDKIRNNPAWARALKRLHGIPVEDVEQEEEMGQTNGVGGGGGEGSNGPGYVNGERKIRKLKRTGSGFTFRMDLNGNGNDSGE